MTKLRLTNDYLIVIIKLSYSKKVAKRGNMEKTVELVLKAREGSEAALSDLLEDYTPLLNSLSRKYSSMCQEDGEAGDDFFQESQIAFYKAVMTYDINNSSSTFGAYAKACVIKSKKRKKGELGMSCESNTPQDTVIWRELGEKLLAQAELTLSPYEKKVFSLYINGRRANEIAKIVGKSEKSVNNAIFRIRSKLKGTVN